MQVWRNEFKKGKFREDLFYRLNTVPIKVAALHERREDIYMLFRKFAIDFAEKYRSEAVALDERAQMVVENYRWPGNVRELKNLVEQLSVLVDKPLVDAESLLEVAPHLLKRNLPSLTNQSRDNDAGFQERELLFKFLLEMKTDLNDLKSLVYELINNNDLSVPDMKRLAKNTDSLDKYMRQDSSSPSQQNAPSNFYSQEDDSISRPIILNNEGRSEYEQTEVVEENLSLESMEKEMIGKALKKHRGRRKDAAEELGISERTLYRKIKQYEIED